MLFNSEEKMEMVYVSIGKRLRKARKEMEGGKWSQKQVAAIGIILQGELSKMENGRREIDTITLLALAEVYNRELSYFFTGKVKNEIRNRVVAGVLK